ncbi:PDZ and LIM domain protein 5a isoform X1 [Erpetoichthys calabaricus]|uniref:PDZ and LIM domain protein 5a isoform X1 n=1 Tax=Erpetoichthys calabaricus TaxID=27687 RepID=UPI0022342624|nr:PDZ and LIM domain protein 5a isoform X1 [Erpetoichthys calabaricus]
MSNYSVSLVGPAPWGFRLQGGKDFNMPLTVSRLTEGGKAALANIAVGDLVLAIDGISSETMTHLEAQNKIKSCTGSLSMTLQKAPNVLKATVVSQEEPPQIIKPVPVASTSPVPFKSKPAAGAAYNKTAKPFGAQSSSLSSSSSPSVASIPSAMSAFTPPSTNSSLAPPPHCVPAAVPPPLAAHSSSSNSVSIQSGHMKPQPNSTALNVSSTSVDKVKVPPTSNAPIDHANNAPKQATVYNSPIKLYSHESIGKVAETQHRGPKENQGVSSQQNGKNPPRRAPRKPIIETDIQFYHVPSHGDASKKRLIEDTEDWRPRTGTSQSRSFRILAQITGTERMQEPVSDPGKKTNEVAEHIEPSPQVSSSVKTMTKNTSGTSKGTPSNVVSATPFKPTGTFSTIKPPIQQTGTVSASVLSKATPSTGYVTSTTLQNTKVPEISDHTLSLNASQKDADTLVQRAEHIPAGTRTPMCGHCNKVIRGPFLLALGKSWHPEEFNCAHCKTSLADIGFVEEKGSVYCEHCYEQFFAPTCGHCQRKILGEVINALKQTWHVYCFLCAACHQPIRNNVFHLEDGEPYCEKDYYNLFGTNCHGCDFPIEAGDKFLEALGYTWHDTCFVCSVCSTNLEGQAFFSKKG